MFKLKSGETFSYKSDAVVAALSSDADLAKWYREQCGVDADWIDNLDASNCRTYGLDSPGDICDMIANDAGIVYCD